MADEVHGGGSHIDNGMHAPLAIINGQQTRPDSIQTGPSESHENQKGFENLDPDFHAENGDFEGDPDENSDSGQIMDDAGPELSNKRIILQRFTIYNSATTMYIVGSNARESLFRIVEITADKDPKKPPSILEIRSYFYTRNDMAGLLEGLNESIEGGIHKVCQAYGLLGFIKFTREYYLLVITKCSQVAVLGGHFVYHVDETKLIPLSFNYRRPDKYSDEERLLSIFKYLDLGRTFYFSYTYDITNSLQTNFLAHKGGNPPEHNERFIWNGLLLEPVLAQPEINTFEWFQPIVHGFIDQANISIYGRKIYITIIARRSHHFAGARFLKRGVNDKGNVANEVETEQIVSDMLTSSFHDPKYGFFANPRYTSFVQHRGSIPLYWTQDLNRLPKPPIEINLSDPFYQSSALHFNNLFSRYGSPVVVLNLIKTKEKQPRESKLCQHFESCIAYLNQFLPTEKRLQYHSFDMSKHSRKNLDVITPLQKIARNAMRKTGFFHNGKDLKSTKLQRGIVRTNCIDCLDRTNAAQFIICKEALSHQLQSLGLIASATDLDYDSDLINILTEMFHDHGDTIAVQYGGSNLVNTMDSYRRINQWSSHTRDVLNSIKRIYSNSFMDSIRQEAINLFLGNYVYDPNKLKLWELQNDYYLHNSFSYSSHNEKTSYMHWYNQRFFEQKPQSNESKEYYSADYRRSEAVTDSSDNWFNECYGQRRFESFGELFQFNMNSNVRYFPPNLSSTPKNFDYSPFETRKPFFKRKPLDDRDSREDITSLQENLHLEEYKQLEHEVKHGGGSQNRLNSPKEERIEHKPRKFSEKLEIVDHHALFEDNDETLTHCHDLNREIHVNEDDMRVYSSQFEPPKMPPMSTNISIPVFKTSPLDSEMYQSLTTNVEPKNGIPSEELVSESDKDIYAQYVQAYSMQGY
ncbi:hypothetical protein OXX80_010824 [Metschnikowia pulcherrima]